MSCSSAVSSSLKFLRHQPPRGSVSYGVDNTSYSRVSLAALGVVLFVLGVPSAIDSAWLGWFDTLAYQLLLPLSVLASSCSSAGSLRRAVAELRQGTGRLGHRSDVALARPHARHRRRRGDARPRPPDAVPRREPGHRPAPLRRRTLPLFGG
ncbi:hypothetical protein C9J85_00045 [Haloferax sp. wsp5]|nr:hypothetical protein C9J85_00045 [Haloferax sp. wsp5]